jgi:hypothetical protein
MHSLIYASLEVHPTSLRNCSIITYMAFTRTNSFYKSWHTFRDRRTCCFRDGKGNTLLSLILLSLSTLETVVLPIQVLWKLRKKDDDFERLKGSPLRDLIGHELDKDQVRNTNWLEPEPSTILNTGSVICSVNHGGASSFHEALW